MKPVIPPYARDLPLPQIASLYADRVVFRWATRIDTLFARHVLWRYGASVGPRLRVSGRLRFANRGRVKVGTSVQINSGPLGNMVGGDRRTNIWVGPGAILDIEDGAMLSNSTIVALNSIIIRRDTYIGGGCDIYDSDFHELDPEDRLSRRGNIGTAPITIGPRAFVGSHSLILKGASIGEGAVVGAGSVVTKDVPPYEIWGGRPARFIRALPSRL